MPGKDQKGSGSMSKIDKKTLRKEFLLRRQSLDAEFRDNANAAICDFLKQLPECVNSELIGAYISDGAEPDLKDFINHCLNKGKKVFLPRYAAEATAEYQMVEIKDLENELVAGKYGLLEPVESLTPTPMEQLHTMTWLVPGVVFDMSGCRLGRGKGVYDRLLSETDGSAIGVFFECQKASHIPADDHDRKLDMVVTEKQIIKFKKV
jgi:5-formyltetrahydrofolate cyclo-ligase